MEFIILKFPFILFEDCSLGHDEELTLFHLHIIKKLSNKYGILFLFDINEASHDIGIFGIVN